MQEIIKAYLNTTMEGMSSVFADSFPCRVSEKESKPREQILYRYDGDGNSCPARSDYAVGYLAQGVGGDTAHPRGCAI